MHTGRTQASPDRRAADAARVRANKLDLLERLADDLAHEIKNPLHSMVINLEVLKRRIGREEGGEPEDLLRYVGVVGGELDRVNRRIELLLRLVRPDRGGDPTTLDEALGELLELFELERERRAVALLYEPSDVPVRAHLPRETARQMVLNLLVGTLDRLPEGGHLAVRTEVDPSESRLRIEGSLPVGAAARDPGADDALAIAGGLAAELGGELHLSAPSPTDPLAAFSLLVTLPLDPSPEA